MGRFREGTAETAHVMLQHKSSALHSSRTWTSGGRPSASVPGAACCDQRCRQRQCPAQEGGSSKEVYSRHTHQCDECVPVLWNSPTRCDLRLVRCGCRLPSLTMHRNLRKLAYEPACAHSTVRSLVAGTKRGRHSLGLCQSSSGFCSLARLGDAFKS